MDQYLSFLQLKPRALAYLKENALQKNICNPNKDRMTWKDLKKILIETYKSIDYHHALRQKLTNLKQMGSIDQYIHDFDKIVSLMDTRAEEFFHFSLAVLKTEIGTQVSLHRPKSYKEAKRIALSVDVSLTASQSIKAKNMISTKEITILTIIKKDKVITAITKAIIIIIIIELSEKPKLQQN
jgi:hypothetical protein